MTLPTCALGRSASAPPREIRVRNAQQVPPHVGHSVRRCAVLRPAARHSGIGTCGKDGQGVPVGVGQPTLLIENLTVGGTAL